MIERNLIIKDNQYRENGGRRNNLYKIITEDETTTDNTAFDNEAADHELCDEVNNEDIDNDIVDPEEPDEFICKSNGETEESGLNQDNYIFETDMAGQKLKVVIRDDIFDYKLLKHSVLVYIHIELKTKYFPSYEQIANTCKVSLAKVANAILELKAKVLIEKISQDKVYNCIGNIGPPPWSIYNLPHGHKKTTHN